MTANNRKDPSAAATTRTSAGTDDDFVHTAYSVDGSQHSIGISASGVAYSWVRRRRGGGGVLGRPVSSSSQPANEPHPVRFQIQEGAATGSGGVPKPSAPSVFRAYAGGSSESGHSMLLHPDRRTLFVAGCDRWQQLGLGSSQGGAAGYTWKQGRIWHTDAFVPNAFVYQRLQQDDETCCIRDIALGGDHSVVLSSNRRHVYTFGKGSEGQLGLKHGKPFVSAPVRSTSLSVTSTSTSDNNHSYEKIAAVCAIQHCSLTLRDDGEVIEYVGKCPMSSKRFLGALNACRRRAESDGLLSNRMSHHDHAHSR